MSFKIPERPFIKDAEGAGRFVLDLMRRYRKWVAKGQGTNEEWEKTIGWIARQAIHWANKDKQCQEERNQD